MIKTKIAQILSPTRVVLAAGTEQGVQVGMEFIIYELSDEIHDPETGEALGQLELHKGRVKVIHVQDKISTATTPRRTLQLPRLADIVSRLGQEEYQEQLTIDENAVTAVKNDLTVKVGDLVRSVS